jgi:hypothetical protein
VQQPVRKGGFPVVNVGDDAEVADFFRHGFCEESITDFLNTKPGTQVPSKGVTFNCA